MGTVANILKADSRGRISLPGEFKRHGLFEYVEEDGCLVLYPVRTVREFPDMSDLPEIALGGQAVAEERQSNRDRRPGVVASSPSAALKTLRKRS
jgi:hypothetical protein